MSKFDKNLDDPTAAIQNVAIDSDILKGLHNMTLAEIPGTVVSTPGKEERTHKVSNSR